MPSVTIGKTFRFEAAHRLPNHRGKCAQPHGHSYLVEVRARGPVTPEVGESSDGMVLDFAELSEAWAEVGAPLDHRDLNSLLPFVTTAEHLALYLLSELRKVVPEVCAVRVWETATSYAEAT